MEKQLPYNLDAEIAVLAVILNNSAILTEDVFGKLVREDFYLESHRVLFDAICLLYKRGTMIDRITVLHELGHTHTEQIGGHAKIDEIMKAYHPNDNIFAHIKILHNTAAIRRLIKSIGRALEACYSLTSAEEIFSYALNEIWKSVTESNSVRGPVAMRDYIPSIMSFLKTVNDKHGETIIDGIATKFGDLDRLTGGLHKKDFIVVGGRPNMGKTALILQLALEAARARKKVLLFSFETSGHALLLRMLCGEARVDCHKIRTGYLAKNDILKLIEAANKISDLPIWIEDAPGLGIHEIWTRARACKNIHNGLDLVIIDTVQLINAPEGDENKEQTRAEQTGATARGLKYMAQDLEVALVTTSQVSRDIEKRKYKRPRLSDLRESGALEEHADLVLFLHREEVFEPTEENAGLTDIIVAKQRNGPPGIVKLVFLKEFTRFETLLKY